MDEQYQRRSAGIRNGGLVARMAGSTALAIGIACVAVGPMIDVVPRSILAMEATAGVIVAAVIVLSIVRWINYRARRNVNPPAPIQDATSESN
ncbi:MAG: hypothetical protein EXS05_18370 [Planctomycetaceae bacterium]|nr:hypothetical protein [Planctomycetaceae bacterium]